MYTDQAKPTYISLGAPPWQWYMEYPQWYYGHSGSNQMTDSRKTWSLQCEAPKISKLVNITPMSLWFMVRK